MSEKSKLNELTLNKWIKIIVVAVFLLAVAIFAPDLLFKSKKPASNSSENTMQVASTTSTKRFTGKNFDVLPTAEKIPVQFDRVVDGDTIIVKLNGHELRTRYLMVDTPESVKEGLKPQPFGKDASKRNEALLEGAKQVYIQFDKGPKADEYDRALTYVYADDVFVAEQLTLEGLASVSYVKPPNNTYEKTLRQAQEKAKKQKIGIWSIPNYVNDKGKFTVQ